MFNAKDRQTKANMIKCSFLLREHAKKYPGTDIVGNNMVTGRRVGGFFSFALATR